MPAKVLQLSQRQIANVVAFCVGYEFEDTIAAVTDVQRIYATDRPGLEFSRRAYKLARLTCGSPVIARRFSPHPRSKVKLEGEFELFFQAFNPICELYSLATIPNWRERSRKAVCFITEVWSDRLPLYLLELLASFDHIFIGCKHSVQAVALITGRPCTYLPLAADVPRFVPASLDQPRPIDVSYIGRRSKITHRALFDEAERGRLFYYYDTVAASGIDLKNRTFPVENPREHRHLLATLLKHSRYYIANRSYVDKPIATLGREEISARFYEGAAAGAVMLGEVPRNDEYKRQFD